MNNNKLLTTFCNLLVLIAVFNLSIVKAVSGPTEISDKLWESHQEGVALAITFNAQSEANKPAGLLTVYVKNISSSAKEYVVRGLDGGFYFYYLDAKGSWQSLYDYDPLKDSGSKVARNIKPGETVSQTIRLDPDLLTLLKGRSIKWHFILIDPATHKSTLIESSPKTLAQMLTVLQVK